MSVSYFSRLIILVVSSICLFSCSSSIQTNGYWVNREKLPAEPIKSVFIIAFTDNMELRAQLENDLAAAATEKGLKVYKSLDIIGPVDIKLIAPVKDVFLKKLNELNCETIFTVALVHETSETKYVPATSGIYTPYAYGAYGGYGGYGAYGMYGGFGGYYGYVVTNISTPGYYTTDRKYFIEGKLFELKTDEVLFSVQSKAHNPKDINKSSKEYTALLMEEIKKMGLNKQ